MFDEDSTAIYTLPPKLHLKLLKKKENIYDKELLSSSTSEAFSTVVMKPDEKHTFIESRSKELTGLMGKGIFEILDRKSVPKEHRIFGTRWVDALKTVDGKTFEKSRLIAQN